MCPVILNMTKITSHIKSPWPGRQTEWERERMREKSKREAIWILGTLRSHWVNDREMGSVRLSDFLWGIKNPKKGAFWCNDEWCKKLYDLMTFKLPNYATRGVIRKVGLLFFSLEYYTQPKMTAGVLPSRTKTLNKFWYTFSIALKFCKSEQNLFA